MSSVAHLAAVPPRLQAAAGELGEMNPDRQRVRYYAASWMRHLGNDDPDLVALAAAHPGSLTRGDLRELSIKAHDDFALCRRLFLATMLWGYGTGGRGPWRTAKMLADPRLDGVLERTMIAVKTGDLFRAYDDFRVAWCGPAFLTKFLYAVALGCSADPLALVLDARVARSLQVLESDGSLKLNEFVTLGPGRTVAWSPAGWVRFVEVAHLWAVALDCRSDAVEMLLFDPPPAFTAFRMPLPSP